MVLFELARLVFEGIRDHTEKAYLQYLEDELKKLRLAHERKEISEEDFERQHSRLTDRINAYRARAKGQGSQGAEIAF